MSIETKIKQNKTRDKLTERSLSNLEKAWLLNKKAEKYDILMTTLKDSKTNLFATRDTVQTALDELFYETDNTVASKTAAAFILMNTLLETLIQEGKI